MDRAALDAALIAAHEEGDHARLVALYAEAANGAEAPATLAPPASS